MFLLVVRSSLITFLILCSFLGSGFCALTLLRDKLINSLLLMGNEKDDMFNYIHFYFITIEGNS